MPKYKIGDTTKWREEKPHYCMTIIKIDEYAYYYLKINLLTLQISDDNRLFSSQKKYYEKNTEWLGRDIRKYKIDCSKLWKEINQ